jgi:hypothetical protein
MSSMRPPRGGAFLAEYYGLLVAPKGDLETHSFRPNALNQPPRFRQAIRTGVQPPTLAMACGNSLIMHALRKSPSRHYSQHPFR